MEIVIKIPDKIYKEYMFVNLGRGNGKTIVYNLLKAIKDGTPLPENHGRLIDADELKRIMEKDPRKALSFVDLTDFIWLAPTIIEGSDTSWK